MEETDFNGHERFRSRRDMYKTYEGYYGKPVGKDTTVSIIKFKLVEDS